MIESPSEFDKYLLLDGIVIDSYIYDIPYVIPTYKIVQMPAVISE